MVKKLAAIITLAVPACAALADPFFPNSIVTFGNERGSAKVVDAKFTTTICVDSDEWKGVVRAAHDLQADIQRVSGQKPEFTTDSIPTGESAIVVGTIGKSKVIDGLIKQGKLDVSQVRGKWESYVVQVVEKGIPGVDRAIVVAGSDKRGTIYGLYEISEQSGVSPWYYWADVPVKKHKELYIKSGKHVQKSPVVQYRGIFINDEAPALSNWVYQNFGEYNSKFYVKVFELLLRLKANYLWPAMWNNCFAQDDPQNIVLADEFGIVMGTSHVEPMMRADKEWNRKGYKENQWNYDKFPKELDDFWTEGILRNKPYESLITIAMRGKIDTPMSETANIALLEKIVESQQNIIKKHLNPDLNKVPMLWALYKEVQEYYDKGMRVPDNVTLLWCDDNWGNIRRLPTLEERNRSGGAGVYYHFDYVGGPRNYKWLNTSPIPRIWEQMNLAYERNAKRIWIVNVGDIKPMEFPLEFFIKMGWNPEAIRANDLVRYTEEWATREFGPAHAKRIAKLIHSYTKLNGRRKPELTDANTYSLTNYNEAQRVMDEWNGLVEMAEDVNGDLPREARDAYYQLVLHPILACANLHDLHMSTAKNRLYAKQNRASTGAMAERVKRLFEKDEDLKRRYHSINGGKWNHMMDQTHISYTYWQQPEKDVMPTLSNYSASPEARLGVVIEGQQDPVPSGVMSLLSEYDNIPRSLELFNMGKAGLEYKIEGDNFLKFTHKSGRLNQDQPIEVNVDWGRVPTGVDAGHFKVIGSDGREVMLAIPLRKATAPRKGEIRGFVESDGYVAIEAENYTASKDVRGAKWTVVPDLSRTSSAVTTYPTTTPAQKLNQDGSWLEYRIYFFTAGTFNASFQFSPTQHLQPGDGLKFGYSVDGNAPAQVNLHEGIVYPTPSWEATVAKNMMDRVVKVQISQPGWHTIRYHAVDSAVIFQRLVIDTGGLKPSYLGPPQSMFRK